MCTFSFISVGNLLLINKILGTLTGGCLSPQHRLDLFVYAIELAPPPLAFLEWECHVSVYVCRLGRLQRLFY